MDGAKEAEKRLAEKLEGRDMNEWTVAELKLATYFWLPSIRADQLTDLLTELDDHYYEFGKELIECQEEAE